MGQQFRVLLMIFAFCFLAVLPAAGQSCNISYAITNSWPTGFQAAISINNTGTAAINGWTLRWNFSGNEQITQLWNGAETQSGQAVTVTNLSYNSTIPAGGSVTGMGFTANSSAPSVPPASFTLNGITCQGGFVGPPAAPTGLVASATSTSVVNLSWVASTSSGVTYNVYRSTTASFTPSASTRIATGLTTTSFTNSGLAAASTFFYFVTAVNNVGESGTSNEASASTQTSIASINPTSGLPGSSATITGSLFGATQGTSTVTFGVTNATVVSWSSSSVTVTVPNLGLGSVSVAVHVNGVASNPVQFLVTNSQTTIHTGNATHFDALGSPFGGCGLPQSALDSQDFVALNVQNTPGVYNSSLPRPIPAQNASQIGLFNNGLNCGRWVQVTMGSFCTGTNDGAPNQPFCRGGNGFVPDQFNGATLNMIVADSCQDGNAWCRDDPNHLDLATASINRFILNGQPVGNILPDHWNNRQISWTFIPAPNYSGDIKVGFIQGANPFFPAIAVTHLLNGIHGVDFFSNGAWQVAKPDSDLGQDFIIGPTVTNGSSYQIRVHDASDQLINNGRNYLFSFPSACGQQCGPPFTQITYTVQ